DPAHRDGDDLGPARLERGGVLGEVLVLSGADDQPRAEAMPGDGPGILGRVAAAADEVHDLEHVAVSKAGFGERRARGDRAVVLDRDLLRLEPELLHELGDGRGGGATRL